MTLVIATRVKYLLAYLGAVTHHLLLAGQDLIEAQPGLDRRQGPDGHSDTEVA